MALFLFVLVAVVLVTLVSGGYVFFAGCFRHNELPWLDAEALKSTSYGRFSEHIIAAKQWLDEHNAQTVSIKNRDGLTAVLVHYRSLTSI